MSDHTGRPAADIRRHVERMVLYTQAFAAGEIKRHAELAERLGADTW